MNIALCSFVAGISAKLYDDLVDNEDLKKYSSEFRLEYLKGIHYILFTIVSLNSPLFLIIQIIFNSVYLFFSKYTYDLPYENSLIYSLPILFLFLPKITFNITILDCLIMLVLLIGTACEALFIKEEVSIKKLIHRTLMIPLFIVDILISYNLRTFLIYALGYGICSVCIQYYMCNKKNKNLTRKIYKYIKKTIKHFLKINRESLI